MNEIHVKTAQVLRDSAQLVRSVSSERDALQEKLAASEQKNKAYERRAACEKLAAQMHLKGFRVDEDLHALADDLEKSAMAGKLPVIEEAVNMAGPNMSTKTASISETHAATGSEFERYLLGNVG
jgi:hypothetical protein